MHRQMNKHFSGNYYTIITRLLLDHGKSKTKLIGLFIDFHLHRFGKRSDLDSMNTKHPLYLRIVKSNSDSTTSSESETNRMFHENIPNGRKMKFDSLIVNFFFTDRIDVDNSYSFEYPIRRRR